MAFKNASAWVIINVVILTLALSLSLPFLHSSTSSLPHGTEMAEKTRTEVATFGNEAGVEESARQVPTGPDPLHHNNKPVGP
ncbi:CLE13 protein precursor [Senna tora]|uniref:CLE13 protein n=1 Tax=Senna tora TaxID=362788 RepID=A0A834TKT9_9FABA|nr:CLE13 protein precursor [Senna tora]